MAVSAATGATRSARPTTAATAAEPNGCRWRGPHQHEEQHGQRGRGGGDRAGPAAQAQAAGRGDLDEVDEQVGPRQLFRRAPHQRQRPDGQPQVQLPRPPPDVHRVAAPRSREALPASVRHDDLGTGDAPPRNRDPARGSRAAARTSTRGGARDVRGRRSAEVHGAAR